MTRLTVADVAAAIGVADDVGVAVVIKGDEEGVVQVVVCWW